MVSLAQMGPQAYKNVPQVQFWKQKFGVLWRNFRIPDHCAMEEVTLDLVGNDFSAVVNDFGIPDRQECIPARRECRLEWKAMVGIKVTSST